MKEVNRMYDYTIEVKREALCWIYNISDKFEVKKDLGDNTFQVFFNTDMNLFEIKEKYGVLFGWEKRDVRA